jgi:hypothetical protein
MLILLRRRIRPGRCWSGPIVGAHDRTRGFDTRSRSTEATSSSSSPHLISSISTSTPISLSTSHTAAYRETRRSIAVRRSSSNRTYDPNTSKSIPQSLGRRCSSSRFKTSLHHRYRYKPHQEESSSPISSINPSKKSLLASDSPASISIRYGVNQPPGHCTASTTSLSTPIPTISNITFALISPRPNSRSISRISVQLFSSSSSTCVRIRARGAGTSGHGQRVRSRSGVLFGYGGGIGTRFGMASMAESVSGAGRTRGYASGVKDDSKAEGVRNRAGLASTQIESPSHSHSHSHSHTHSHSHSHGIFSGGHHHHDHSEGAGEIIAALTGEKKDKGSRITLLGTYRLWSRREM